MLFEKDDIITTVNYKGLGTVISVITLVQDQVVNVKMMDGTQCSYVRDQLVNLSTKLSQM